jgi:hypothetical protein
MVDAVRVLGTDVNTCGVSWTSQISPTCAVISSAA